jgi:hypothetical protein
MAMPGMQSMHWSPPSPPPSGLGVKGAGIGPAPMHAVAFGHPSMGIPSMQFMHGGVVMFCAHNSGLGHALRYWPGVHPTQRMGSMLHVPGSGHFSVGSPFLQLCFALVQSTPLHHSGFGHNGIAIPSMQSTHKIGSKPHA